MIAFHQIKTAEKFATNHNVCFHCKNGEHHKCHIQHCMCDICATDKELPTINISTKPYDNTKSIKHKKKQTKTIKRKEIQWAKNPEYRLWLYKTLTQEFGPYNKWQGINTPGPRGSKVNQLFNQTLEEVTRKICEAEQIEYTPKKKQAVHNQFRWCITKQHILSNKHSGQINNFLINRKAALETGFIGENEA